ncbi:MAG: hypothetical protein GEU68_16005 [Actinobacteria bacterium]|nr:hypothetical protein [Actinomycetota bacterium]
MDEVIDSCAMICNLDHLDQTVELEFEDSDHITRSDTGTHTHWSSGPPTVSRPSRRDLPDVVLSTS